MQLVHRVTGGPYGMVDAWADCSELAPTGQYVREIGVDTRGKRGRDDMRGVASLPVSWLLAWLTERLSERRGSVERQ